MNDVNARDAKLIQYLNEAYGKEKELETALQAHISMTTRPPYKKRLRQHLTETRDHARQVERRIKKLGGSAATTTATGQSVAARALATAKGPLHMVRGLGEEEKLLKNAKTEYSEEAEEIATYTAIETLAETVGDRETAKVARSIRRDEERMAKYLERLIPQLSKAVARSEVPSDQRNSSRRRQSRSGSSRKASARRSGSTRKASSRRSGSTRKASSRRSSARGGSKTGRSTTARRRTTGTRRRKRR
jgi:ferritin-like metal-binding protein YciE